MQPITSIAAQLSKDPSVNSLIRALIPAAQIRTAPIVKVMSFK